MIAATGELRPIAFTRADRAVSAQAASGEFVVSARDMQLDGVSPNGRAGKGSILILYDQTSGYFLWILSWAPGNKTPTMLADYMVPRSKVYVASDRINVFMAALPSIWVNESSQKAS